MLYPYRNTNTGLMASAGDEPLFTWGGPGEVDYWDEEYEEYYGSYPFPYTSVDSYWCWRVDIEDENEVDVGDELVGLSLHVGTAVGLSNSLTQGSWVDCGVWMEAWAYGTYDFVSN